MSDYRVTTPVITTDARGALGMLRQIKYSEVVAKKDVKKAIRKSLTGVRREVRNAAKGAMAADPRKAYQGVKTLVYRRGQGGNVSLLSQKATNKVSTYEIVRGGKSGITRRRRKSQRTRDIESYVGRDRSFILRFLNEGTASRSAFTRSGGKQANRGAISARNFFAAASQSGMQRATQELSERIQQLIKEVGDAAK